MYRNAQLMGPDRSLWDGVSEMNSFEDASKCCFEVTFRGTKKKALRELNVSGPFQTLNWAYRQNLMSKTYLKILNYLMDLLDENLKPQDW